jgi:hypothetical protein
VLLLFTTQAVKDSKLLSFGDDEGEDGGEQDGDDGKEEVVNCKLVVDFVYLKEVYFIGKKQLSDSWLGFILCVFTRCL